MKFLSSSASSTITTTTASSFDGNVNSSKSATAGCIAGVFRRLLCLNSLPTYPSDHFRETEQDHSSEKFDKLQCMKAEVKIESSATPNIVARLMGLESLPQMDLLNEQKVSSSISRSKSMNYVDSLKELQSIQDQGRHRRVKSFRETPTFLDLEDENFLILSFENGAERMKLALKGRKPEATKNKRRESVFGKNKENQDANHGSDEELEKLIMDCTKSTEMVSYDGKFKHSSNILRSKNSYQNSLAVAASELTNFAKPTIDRPQSTERGRRRIKKRKDECLPVNKMETESDSENSSPNSVLNNIDFPCDPEDTSSGGALPRLKNSKTRRTLTEELEKYRKLNLLNGQSLIRNSSKSKSAEGKCAQFRRKYVDMWDEICKVAEKDIIKSSWVQNKIHNFEDCEEISTELEFKILDQLVNELEDLLLGELF